MHLITIGIDTGVNTGFAVWDNKHNTFMEVTTCKIHEAMDAIKEYINKMYYVQVRFEDANLRKWFGNANREKLQGAGSIKRDGVIWRDFLTDLKIPFEAVAPKNNVTKLNAETFKKLTGWPKQTNVHGRDAAMLVFYYNRKIVML